jgi:RIO kinase 1
LVFYQEPILIELGPLLVQGGWCQILAIQGQPDMCAKVLIPKRRFKGARPDPDLIVKTKYGIDDFLEYEWNNYQKIMAACPDDLKPYFVRMHGIQMTTDGRKALVMDTVFDDHGAVASNLVSNAEPLRPQFRQILERIRNEVFIAHNIDHFGIVRRNILVRNPEHPVIIDFQTGRERFRGQFWLRYQWFVKQKINRCFRKMYQEMEKN